MSAYLSVFLAAMIWLLVGAKSDNNGVYRTNRINANKSIDSMCDESGFREDYLPLHFHQVHGGNIKLTKNRTVASRFDSFYSKGITFSDRSVMACEPVYVKIVKYTDMWTSMLRIGFSKNDPMSFESKLPNDTFYSGLFRYSNYGIWMKSVDKSLAKLGSVVHFYADQNGDVHYGFDSGERGILFRGVDTSGGLWAVIDVLGRTVAVEIIDPTCSTEYAECEQQEGTCVTNSTTIGCIVDSYAQRMGDKDEKENCKDKYRGCLNSKGTCKVKEDGVFCQCPDIATYSTEMKKCTIDNEKCDDTFPGCLSSGGVCRLESNEASCQCPELASYKIDKKMCIGTYEYMKIVLWVVLCLIAVTLILVFGYVQCRKRNKNASLYEKRC